ncbi:MAG: FG-GAP and VCBS repeat-containing protein [Chthoniobacteraceae bacterium]
MTSRILSLAAVLVSLTARAAEVPEPKFKDITLDDQIQIGYGLAVADVDGDKLPDVLLADKKQFVWYRNPGPEKAGDPAAWKKFLMAENLTEHDNVCLAAEDIDGDGKCEVAVGAEWNPGDTVNSGAVFYLIAPEDRTQKWTPVKFPAVEPTTHRMRWVKLAEGKWGLVVLPLHGRGNKNGEGAPVKVLLYHPPTPVNDPTGEWTSEVIDESMHATHNFETSHDATALWIGGKEGVTLSLYAGERWTSVSGHVASARGAGEVREGRISRKKSPFLATISPMHGNDLSVWMIPTKKLNGNQFGEKSIQSLLAENLIEGHALATGDLLGTGGDQIVVGWRGSKPEKKAGIALWAPLDESGEKWRETSVDDGGMACEDLKLADLNGDGKLDIVASGRATKNVKIYFNETP